MRDVSAMAASTTVFVGDVHGMNFKLTRLFANLERKLGQTALIARAWCSCRICATVLRTPRGS